MGHFSEGRIFIAGNHTVAILSSAALRIAELAGIMAPLETGGVLIGKYYRLDGKPERYVTVIEGVIAAPADSVSRVGEFTRGNEGLAETLNAFADQGLDYLGEWHTHDSGDVRPSQIDHETLREIAGDPGYLQPSPVLVIGHAVQDGHRLELDGLGGRSIVSAWGEFPELSVTIYPSGEIVTLDENHAFELGPCCEPVTQ